MWKKGVIAFTLAAFLNITLGCTKTVIIKPEKVTSPKEKIIKIAPISGPAVVFAKQGAHYDRSTNQISGFIKSSDTTRVKGRRGEPVLEPYSISADSVVTVWVKRSDPAMTTLAIVSVAILAIVVIAVATADDEPEPTTSGTEESCPFVYSFDGTQYVFDAEPLGGAVCRALERSEYSRMENIASVDGKYRLKIRNETPETQYLDQVQLFVVDHEPGQDVVPDATGKLHLVRQVIPATEAVDERGRDILPFIKEADGMLWQTIMTEEELTASSETRHHLTLNFPKPQNARTAHLIFNAGTAIWGSHMIREMIEAHGDAVDDWYESLNQNGPKFHELVRFTFREELYILKMYVQKDNMPAQRGLIFGGGPFATENRVTDIDVSDIEGDELTLTLNPPKGFWSLDYLAVYYDNDSTVAPIRCELSEGYDQVGRLLADDLSLVDGTYHIMPQIGDWVDLEFAVPPQDSATKRSVFMNTTGYYELHIDKNLPEQKDLIESVLNTPGAIADYSTQGYIQKYRQWKRMQGQP